MNVPKVLTHYDHIPLHRLWAFIRLQTDLTLPEYSHLFDCEECRVALQTCMEANSFGAVLKKLKKDGGDDSIAQAS